MKTLVALYDTRSDADAAGAELRDAGVAGLSVDVVADSGFGAASGHGDVVPRLIGWGVPESEAHEYAEGLRRGGALVVASAGDAEAAQRAAALLRSAAGTDTTGRPLGAAAAALRDANAGTGDIAGDTDEPRVHSHTPGRPDRTP